MVGVEIVRGVCTCVVCVCGGGGYCGDVGCLGIVCGGGIYWGWGGGS